MFEKETKPVNPEAESLADPSLERLIELCDSWLEHWDRTSNGTPEADEILEAREAMIAKAKEILGPVSDRMIEGAIESAVEAAEARREEAAENV